MSPASWFRKISLGLLWAAMVGIAAMFAGDAWYILSHLTVFARQLSEGAAQEAGLWSSMGMSIGTATVSTAVALALGIPAAYALARGWAGRSHRWMETFLDLPIVIPPLLVGISLLVLFSLPSVRGLLGGVQEATGVNLNPVYTWGGIVLAQVVIAGSLGVRILQTAFERVPLRLEEAARTLGAGPWQVFVRVTLPMAWRGLLASGIIIWTRSMAEFAPILMLYGSHQPNVLPVTAFLELSTGRIEMAIAITLLMVGISAVSLVMVRRLGTQVATW